MVSLSRVDKIKKAYKEGGIPLILLRTKRTLFRTNSAWWYIRDLSLSVREFSIKFPLKITDNQFDRVLDYMKRKEYISDEELTVGKKEKHIFWGLISEGEIRGFCKCGFKRVFVNDFKEIISLPEDVAFIYEYEIDEKLRGKGIAKYFISTILKELKKDNWRYVICHIPPWNIPSIKVVEACGFRKMGFIRFIEFAGIKWKSKSLRTLLNQAIRYETA